MGITYSNAQEGVKYATRLLDTTLTKEANAVVRSEKIDVEINSISSVTVRTKRVVTVLNKYGKNYADWYEYYSPSRKIKSLEVIIYDALGTEVKKYRKKDFQDQSIYDGFSLMNDDRMKFVEYTPTSYPYTVVFYSAVESSSTAFITQWMPITSLKMGLEKSEYTIINNTDIGIRYHPQNFENFDIKKDSVANSKTYTLSNVPAKKGEVYSPSYLEQVPILMVALNQFSLEGVEGQGKDWKSLGKWQYEKLLMGRNKLSQETINEINNLVAGASSDIEKAKLIYEYVQKKTRYISIQLGIGGWMPFQASDVDQLGYGDCKALTNYTKALLDSQNITSHYTVVFADDRRDIEPNFASMQGNHVILNIPNQEEDIWLECTSQTLPFNFIGSFTDDRNVLVVKPDGGEIKRTKKYLPEENEQLITASINLFADKSMRAKVSLKSKGLEYDNSYGKQFLLLKDQKVGYKKRWAYINSLDVTQVTLEDDKEQILFKEDLHVGSRAYAKKIGSRLLITPNVFGRELKRLPEYQERKQPLIIERGYVHRYDQTITIPDGFQIGELPSIYKIDSEFGTYAFELKKINESQIKCNRFLKIVDGRFPKEKYDSYRQFWEEINKVDHTKIILTKK